MTTAALDSLVAAAPRSLGFSEIAAMPAAHTTPEQESVASVIFQAFPVGLLEIRIFEPACVLAVTERPVASPWARFLAHSGRVVNLYHEIIELDDCAKRAVSFADGTRTVAEVAISCFPAGGRGAHVPGVSSRNSLSLSVKPSGTGAAPRAEGSLAEARTIYDEVPYNTLARTPSHVDRIAVLGRLFGLDSAHPNAARVLELGCGNGSNLIPMALSLPGSEFVGIDLAATAVERGNDLAARAGITNVRLEAGDIAELGPAIGDFDYIIAHGVFSWVPEHVRHALLKLVRERMRPAGVAFVSYNALPGDQVRGIIRQMMRMHTEGIENSIEKMSQARELLALLSKAPDTPGNIYGPLIETEVGKAIFASDDTLFHDDLSEANQSYYVSEFIAMARGYGLEFLAETPFHMMSAGALPPEMVEVLREKAAQDIVLKEQYLDFFTCRGFRQTLLCHREAPVKRAINVERMRQFRVATYAERDSEPDGRPGVVAFRHQNGSSIRTDNPFSIRAMDVVIDASPRSVPFDDLVSASGATDEAGVQALAAALFQMFGVGLIELHLHEPPMVTTVSERPVASPWARVGPTQHGVANLLHEMIDLNDETMALIPLLDGSKTVEEVAAAVSRPEAAVRAAIESLGQFALLVG